MLRRRCPGGTRPGWGLPRRGRDPGHCEQTERQKGRREAMERRMHVLRGVQVGSEVDEGVNERLAENHGGKPAGGRRRQEQRREGGCPEEKPEAQPFRTAELPQHGREERERVADTFGEPGRPVALQKTAVGRKKPSPHCEGGRGRNRPGRDQREAPLSGELQGARRGEKRAERNPFQLDPAQESEREPRRGTRRRLHLRRAPEGAPPRPPQPAAGRRCRGLRCPRRAARRRARTREAPPRCAKRPAVGPPHASPREAPKQRAHGRRESPRPRESKAKGSARRPAGRSDSAGWKPRTFGGSETTGRGYRRRRSAAPSAPRSRSGPTTTAESAPTSRPRARRKPREEAPRPARDAAGSSARAP